jgi:uncharacterized protein (TIGR03437 family)
MIFLCLFRLSISRFFLPSVLLAFLLLAPLAGVAQAQSQTPGIKTDRAVYPEPPLPALPRAGGKFNDPVFGTEIMRATDETECPAPGCGTYYSHWPTFNSNNTYVLVRKGVNGAALIKSFDAVNFTIGAGHQPGGIYVPGHGETSVNFESAIWHPTDPKLIYCFSANYDGGMKLYTYNVVTKQYTLVKDLGSLGGPKDFLHQMSMSSNGDVFAWSHMREGAGGDPVYYIVWRKSTDKVLYHTATPNNMVNEVRLDKSGNFLAVPYNNVQPDGRKFAMLNVTTGVIDYGYWNSTDSPTGHGDMGTGFNAGWDHWSCGINRHSLDNIHSTQVLFRFLDLNGVADWTNDFHATLLADDESWLTVGAYDYAPSNLPETGIFEDEIFQVKLDGSGEFRRLLHTRSAVDEQTITTSYWAAPKPTISKDGRFIAYTSNWEKSGRYDLFIARIDPPNSTPVPQPSSPGLVSAAQATANTLAGNASNTETQIRELITSIESAYSKFTSEADRFASRSQIETGLRAALYFSRAAAALCVVDGNSAGIKFRLQIAASYLAQVKSLMSTSSASSVQSDGASHAITGGPLNIGPADTRSNASFMPLLAPKSIGVVVGDTNQSLLAPETRSASLSPDGHLPFEVSGVSVTIGGKTAQLLTISPSRITFYVPEGLPDGDAEVIVTTQEGYVSRGSTVISAIAPALFSASGNGTGAGMVMNAVTYSPGGFDVITDLNMSADKRTRLMVFASGISNGAANTNTANDISIPGRTLPNLAESVVVEARASDGRTWQLPVEYAGMEGHLPGLDQVNIILPAEIKGAGNVELTVIVGNNRSNKVTVNIR